MALIWGSTWFVIKGQLDVAPPSWSVTWRFALATLGMFALALVQRHSFRMSGRAHLLAVAIGVAQFCLNFNFVYRAELHLTSGIVAVLFGLLVVPNAVFARIFLGQPITRRFLVGSAIGLAGIALLLLHEAQTVGVAAGREVGLGILFTGLGILSASSANVMQASAVARTAPIVVLLSWAMLWASLANCAIAWTIAGPPVLPLESTYLLGIAYLAIIGSVVTFPLYFALIRELGAGRAAYNGVVVPVVAMLLSTMFEGYRWSVLAAAGGALAMAGMVVALRARQLPVSSPAAVSDPATARSPAR
ncbi:DMT family transporter [Altericroceibacterium xinjiangense]|uniref:DMT family transporter n=1 Tax=Altericroceibacterium xinjiangense TaxID=762261 RepID=UPI001F49402C|nr:EamA family transporter [Altericroceibacterium xinjiangense]